MTMPTTMGRAMVVILRKGSTKAADKAAVLQLGNDYAFAMEDGHGEVHLCHGRLLQMKRRNKSQMYTPIFLNDAKLEGALVCSWFSETAFGELIYNSDMDYSAYSAWCCLGHVDLVFVENAGGDFYVFNDPEAVENLQLALELTKADDPGQQRQIEEPAEAAVRRQAVEQGRAAGALAAESLDVREVLRAPGKRFATSAVTRK